MPQTPLRQIGRMHVGGTGHSSGIEHRTAEAPPLPPRSSLATGPPSSWSSWWSPGVRSLRSLQALASAAGFLRHELGSRLSMRYIPSLQFRSDISIAHSDRIAQLLNQLDAEGGSTAPAAEATSQAETTPDAST